MFDTATGASRRRAQQCPLNLGTTAVVERLWIIARCSARGGRAPGARQGSRVIP